jgi:hypothetical protein
MTVPGLFIEYLIVGALALIWIYPLLHDRGLPQLQPAHLPLLALGLYVVGMVVDFLAWILTSYLKRGLRAWADGGHQYSWEEILKILKGGAGSNSKRGSITSRQVYLAIHAPEAAKEAAMRSSRDRIARGAIINSILFTYFASSSQKHIGVLMILLFFIMWVNFELSSYTYELRAEQVVKDNTASNRSNCLVVDDVDPQPTDKA